MISVCIDYMNFNDSIWSERVTYRDIEYVDDLTVSQTIEKKDKRADAGKTAQLILYVHKNNVSIQRKPFLRRFDVI